MIWSPSTTLPAASTARQRSASPSWAMPTSAPTRTHVLGERVEVRRADAVVDVQAVGVGADHGDAGARVAEGLGRDSGGRAVRAVEHDVDAVEPVRQRPEQVHDVAVFGVGEAADAPDVARRSAAASGPDMAASMRCSTTSGSLTPPRAKILMPLSGAGLCDAETMTPKSASMSAIRNAADGRGQHAGVEHVDAGRGEAGRDGGGEELTRDARIARDDGGEALAGGACAPRQYGPGPGRQQSPGPGRERDRR